MKEELRKLWYEYEEECFGHVPFPAERSIEGFWWWVLTGKIKK